MAGMIQPGGPYSPRRGCPWGTQPRAEPGHEGTRRDCPGSEEPLSAGVPGHGHVHKLNLQSIPGGWGEAVLQLRLLARAP